ncbi:hypothetical protein B0H17DRAFT_1141811 [Mycena rosella]|uniref:Uncharacterized protein n=1 Tax=Mycena rosella TaxID=1033263 RepID=A0AAD7CYR7_MYCRO|nr:hypothetical protein B0H17DRAFT_1141811 [Mycena rosella]
MSTGGRAPTRSESFIDDEAEEDNEDQNSNDNNNEEMRDFIVSDNDEYVDVGMLSTYRLTSLPIVVPVEDWLHSVSPDSKLKSKNKSRVDLPSKNTRSRSKAASDSDCASLKTDTVCGKQSPFSKFGSAPSENQKKLEVRPSSKSVSISTSEYKAFKQYLAKQGDSSGTTLGSALKQKSKGASKINNAESKAKTVSTSRKPAKGWVYLDDDTKERRMLTFPPPINSIMFNPLLRRQASKKGASQLSKRKHEIPDHEDLDEDEQPPKKKPSKSTAVTNTKHASMDSEDELERVPAPALLRSWLVPLKAKSSAQGPGNILLSTWDQYNKILNVDSAWSFINFVQKGVYVNLSRIDPRKLEGIAQIYSTDKARHVIRPIYQGSNCSLSVLDDGSQVICIYPVYRDGLAEGTKA